MSKKKMDTEVLTNAGSPEVLTFDEMKKMVSEYKKLGKAIKAISKEDRAKLMPKRERVITDNIKPLTSKIEKLLTEYRENLEVEFKTTISTEKPNGQKWIGYKFDKFRIHIQLV